MTIFNAAVFLMGLHRRRCARRARHRDPDRVAHLHGAAGRSAMAVTVRVGRAFGARRPGGVGARRLDGLFALGFGFMALTAAVMLLAPDMLVGVFLDVPIPRNRIVVGPRRHCSCCSPPCSSSSTAHRRSASGMLRGLHDTRVPMMYAALGYWGDRLAARRGCSPSGSAWRASASGSASPRASPSSRSL